MLLSGLEHHPKIAHTFCIFLPFQDFSHPKFKKFGGTSFLTINVLQSAKTNRGLTNQLPLNDQDPAELLSD